MLMLLDDSLNLIVSRVKFWTVIGSWLRRKEIESFALQQLDCVECKMHQCTVLLKDKMVINDIPAILSTPVLDKNNSHFDRVTDVVNIKHEGNILQDAMLPSYVLSGANSRSF